MFRLCQRNKNSLSGEPNCEGKEGLAMKSQITITLNGFSEQGDELVCFPWCAWPYKSRGMNQLPRMRASADKSQWESCSVHRLGSRSVMPRAVWKELLQPGIPKLLWAQLWTHSWICTLCPQHPSVRQQSNFCGICPLHCPQHPSLSRVISVLPAGSTG